MKDAHLGEYLLWEGELAKIIGEIDRKAVLIETIDDKKCPHCGESLGKDQFTIIVSSPLFQENAEPLKTIKDE